MFDIDPDVRLGKLIRYCRHLFPAGPKIFKAESLGVSQLVAMAASKLPN
jgi:hypothetical protein